MLIVLKEFAVLALHPSDFGDRGVNDVCKGQQRESKGTLQILILSK